MSVVWKINGQTAEALGVRLAGGSFVTQGISHALLDVARDVDQAPVLNYGQAVTISRTEDDETVIIFQGKVAPPVRHAMPQYEGHDYPIEDAWAELETTTYQEEWKVGAGSHMFPKAVLGLDKNGDPINIGAQIAEIITYAASQGVALQMGSAPAGENLWPEEVSNMSCAEGINRCLEFHPDWIPWIDHSTVPPTFNVTRTADMATVNVPLFDANAQQFTETDRADLRPQCVRIVYEFASTIDDTVFRNAVIDKYPGGGPDGGPKVICTTIPLAGQQMQMQKSRVRVRPIPESGTTGDLTKKWIKANYPQLKDVDLEDFTVEEWETELYQDDEADNPHPEAVNERAQRLVPEDVGDVPNQLLEGSIEDWMRKRVGWVSFKARITAAESAPAEAKEAIAKGLAPGRCVATNAVSKIYKGITQWAAPEDVPAGIAQGIYQSMHAAYKTEGGIRLATGELTGMRYHGMKLTVTGSATAGAVIHSVSWDIGSGKTSIGFGPVPQLAPADFLEQQRRMRGRKVTWWSKNERSGNELGAESKPSAAGDTVSGYHQPQILFEPATGGEAISKCSFGSLDVVDGDTVIRGGWVKVGDKNYDMPHKVLALGTPGKWRVMVKKDQIECSTDDDQEIFLPGGIKTATGDPEWVLEPWTEGGHYTDNIDPANPTAKGTLFVPVGILTIEDGAADLDPARCGWIEATQCAGVLSIKE